MANEAKNDPEKISCLSAGEDVQVSGGGEREATGFGFSSEKWLWKEGLYSRCLIFKR